MVKLGEAEPSFASCSVRSGNIRVRQQPPLGDACPDQVCNRYPSRTMSPNRLQYNTPRGSYLPGNLFATISCSKNCSYGYLSRIAAGDDRPKLSSLAYHMLQEVLLSHGSQDSGRRLRQGIGEDTGRPLHLGSHHRFGEINAMHSALRVSSLGVRGTIFQLRNACEASSGGRPYKAVVQQQHSSSFVGIPILLSSCT